MHRCPHLVRGSEREEKEVKKGDANWLRGFLSLSNCLVNQLTCSPKEPLWAHSGGRPIRSSSLSVSRREMVPLVCGEQQNAQTDRPAAGRPSSFLSPSLSKMPNLTSLRGKLPDWPPARGPACPSTTYLFNSVPLPLPLHALTPTVCQLQHTYTGINTHSLDPWISF